MARGRVPAAHLVPFLLTVGLVIAILPVKSDLLEWILGALAGMAFAWGAILLWEDLFVCDEVSSKP
jgi:hypothetical protein